MKKHLTMLIRVLAAAMTALTLTAGCTGSDDDDTYRIGIIQIIDHPALDASRQGFKDGMTEAGFVEGENVVYDFQNAQGDPSNLQLMSEQLIENKSDLILAIATSSAQSIASLTDTIPIVITAVTDPVEAELVHSYDKPGTNVTGTSDLTPVAKQIELLQKLLPDAATVGIMYNASEINSQIQANIAVEACERLGLRHEIATVTGQTDVSQVTESIVGKVDVIYVPTDNVLAASVPLMLKITDEAGIPIIIGEEGGVEQGALATEGLNYYNLGKQTAAMAVRILNGEAEPKDMPIEYLQETSIVINRTTADKLGIEIPADLAAAATFVD